MYWSHGAWRISDKDKLRTDQAHCMAFFESDANHPTAMPGVLWKGTVDGRDFDFDFTERVIMATGTVRVSCWDSSGRGNQGAMFGTNNILRLCVSRAPHRVFRSPFPQMAELL